MRQLLIILFILFCACPSYAVYEDFDTDWSETDADGDITLSDTVIDLNASDPSGRVYKRIGAQNLNGLRWKLKTKAVTNPFGRRVAIFGISTDTDTDWTDWTDGFVVYWMGPSLCISNIEDETLDGSILLSLDTDYYLEIRRVVNQLRCLIYSDEYSTLIDTIALDDFDKYMYGSDVTLMSPEQITHSSIHDDDHSTLTGWTNASVGTSAITQTTFDTESTFKGTATGNGTASNYCSWYKDVGTFPSKCVIEIKEQYEALTTSGTRPIWYIYGGSYRVIFYIYSGKITVTNGAGYDDISLTTNVDTWYTWQLAFDWSTNRCMIFRNGVFIHSIESFNAATSYPNGTIYCQVNGHSKTGTATLYQDYTKVYSVESGTCEVFVEDAYDYPINFHSFVNPFTCYTGDLEEDFTSIAEWTTGGTGTCEVSDSELSIDGDGYCYQAVAGGASAWVATTSHTVSAVVAGDAAHLIAVYDGTKYMQAAIVESGGVYYWTLLYDTSGTQGAVVSDHQVNLDQTYSVQLAQHNAGGNYQDTALIIDGIAVAAHAADANIQPDKILYGAIDETLYDAGGTFTADNLHVMANRVFYFPSIDRLSNNDLIVTARRGTKHTQSTGDDIEAITSDDEGLTWSHHGTIDLETDVAGRYPVTGHLFINGDDVYVFVPSITSTPTQQTNVYKATVSGGTLGAFSITAATSTLVIFPQIVDPDDSDILLCTGYDGYDVGGTDLWLTDFDMSTDTFNASGSWIELATEGDYTSAFPNEACMRVDPSDSANTLLFVRWDDYTGNDQKFISYRVCTGDEHTIGDWAGMVNLKDDWSDHTGAGTPKLVTIGDQILMIGYAQESGASADTQNHMRNILLQFDPSDPSTLINGRMWNNISNNASIEPGNGDIIPPDPGDKYHLMVIDSGSAGFYTLDAGINASLTVTISGEDGTGQWRFTGESTWLDEGERVDIPSGDYTIEYSDVAGYVKPANNLITLAGGDQGNETGVYTSGFTAKAMWWQ